MGFAARRLGPASSDTTSARVLQLAQFANIRKLISAALANAVPEKVEMAGGRKYVRFRLSDPRTFHHALFATIAVGNRGTLLVIGTPKAAIKKPAALGTFLKRLGSKGLKTEARRSLVYQLRSAGIIGGSRTQAVLVPVERVLAVGQRFHVGGRRAAANPILATAGFNPGWRKARRPSVRRNEGGGAVQINVPFRDGQKITPARMRQWLDSLPENAITKMIRSRFEKAMTQYARFHDPENHAAEPTHFTYQAVQMGSQGKRITDVDVVVSEGKEWAAPYQVPKSSGKYDPTVQGRYIHAHGDSKMDVDIKKAASTKKLPERFHTADGRFVGVVPTRNVRITDWYRG